MPVMTREAFVRCKIRHRRAILIMAQRGGSLPWVLHRSAHAAFLERWRRIVRSPIETGTQRRRSHGDIELVFRWDIEQPGRARIATSRSPVLRYHSTISSSLRGAT